MFFSWNFMLISFQRWFFYAVHFSWWCLKPVLSTATVYISYKLCCTYTVQRNLQQEKILSGSIDLVFWVYKSKPFVLITSLNRFLYGLVLCFNLIRCVWVFIHSDVVKCLHYTCFVVESYANHFIWYERCASHKIPGAIKF